MQLTDAMAPEVESSSFRASPNQAAAPPRAVAGRDGGLVSVGERDGDRIWIVLAHLWPLIGCLTGTVAIIWLGPIVIWITRKDDSPLIDDQGRELINSMLTLLLLLVIPVIGWLAALVWIPVWLVNAVRGAIHSSRAEYFRYPMTIRFLT